MVGGGGGGVKGYSTGGHTWLYEHVADIVTTQISLIKYLSAECNYEIDHKELMNPNYNPTLVLLLDGVTVMLIITYCRKRFVYILMCSIKYNVEF